MSTNPPTLPEGETDGGQGYKEKRKTTNREADNLSSNQKYLFYLAA